jgi:hypothetical protein
MVGKKKRRRSRRLGKIRRHLPKKVPIEVLVAGAMIPITPSNSGWSSILDYATKSDWVGLARTLQSGFLGMVDDKIDIIQAINPFNMESARFTKMLIISGIIGSIRAKISGRYTTPLFSKIPIIGRWIK